MDTVTISPKFQVVIPKAMRERLKLRAGQQVQAIAYDDRIELVPVRPARSLRGALKGLDTRVPRERRPFCRPSPRTTCWPASSWSRSG